MSRVDLDAITRRQLNTAITKRQKRKAISLKFILSCKDYNIKYFQYPGTTASAIAEKFLTGLHGENLNEMLETTEVMISNWSSLNIGIPDLSKLPLAYKIYMGKIPQKEEVKYDKTL